MWYFVAGSAFLLLGLVAKYVDHRLAINKKFEEAKADAKKAIDSGDMAALLDAQRRMCIYR